MLYCYKSLPPLFAWDVTVFVTWPSLALPVDACAYATRAERKCGVKPWLSVGIQ